MNIYICSKENPLHKQMNDKEKETISEIKISGYLETTDLVLLEEMSINYCLRKLDMQDVTELNSTEIDYDGWERNVFCGCKALEEVILPEVEIIDFPIFEDCWNLKTVEIPSSIKQLNKYFLLRCPNVEEINVPIESQVVYDGRYEDDFCFVGSGKRFVSDNEGWPYDLRNVGLFTFDGVLYDGSSLYRYPAGDEREEFVIPEGITEICENAFYGNCNLKCVTIPKSLKYFDISPFSDCDDLETIIFKNKSFRVFSDKDYTYFINGYPNGVKTSLSNLKDIYLYAENPEDLSFSLFDTWEDLHEVTLHVPCFSKRAYQQYEVTFHCYEGHNYSEHKEKVYNRFSCIEEFDPADIFHAGEDPRGEAPGRDGAAPVPSAPPFPDAGGSQPPGRNLRCHE